MSTSLAISLALAALYLIFLFWYGGRGTPLTRAEIDLRSADSKADRPARPIPAAWFSCAPCCRMTTVVNS
jgi:hypothetical protein